MKKTALIFLLAIFVPALVLGALALRTATQQRIIIAQQEAQLRQAETDRIAGEIRAALASEQQAFIHEVEQMVGSASPQECAAEFTDRLKSGWPRRCIGFAVTLDGKILSPSIRRAGAGADTRLRAFLRDNTPFLGSEVSAQVYQAPSSWEQDGAPSSKLAEAPAGRTYAEKSAPAARGQESEARALLSGKNGEVLDVNGNEDYGSKDKLSTRTTPGKGYARGTRNKENAAPSVPNDASDRVPQLRNVAPQNAQPSAREQLVSQLKVADSRFSQLVSAGENGTLSRFVQDTLQVVFWARLPGDPNIVFGAQMDPADLRDLIEAPIAEKPSVSFRRSQSDACVAVLDDRANPFAKSLSGIAVNWKAPFVASEVGEVLPHWEVALYLADPHRLDRSARLVNLTLIGLIALALGAIGWGSYLVVADTRRQLALVQKKTDFVSNVSHELKTPLTSIRMFAELLQEKRIQDPEKVSGYLRIITLEAERLTRLINNVLDFAKLERGQKRYDKRPLDLQEVIRRVWDAQQIHLRNHGFELSWQTGPGPYPVFGDEDALAQVLVNLISNAEKYSGAAKRIDMQSYVNDGRVCVSLLDRGIGVPPGREGKIFEHFYRAHDSLSSGIQGSGLGLTLARKIAEDHGGTVRYMARAGGGSNFTLELPQHQEHS